MDKITGSKDLVPGPGTKGAFDNLKRKINTPESKPQDNVIVFLGFDSIVGKLLSDVVRNKFPKTVAVHTFREEHGLAGASDSDVFKAILDSVDASTISPEDPLVVTTCWEKDRFEKAKAGIRAKGEPFKIRAYETLKII